MPRIKFPDVLTAEKALDLSIELWKWIAKTGSNRKQDWPGWAKAPFTFKFYCPLCEYVGDKSVEACLEKCPWGRWKGQRCIDVSLPYTTNYAAWVGADQADPLVRSAYARSFVAELKEVRKEIAR